MAHQNVPIADGGRRSSTDRTNNDRDTIPNRERGCGYLKDDAAYVRAEYSTGGLLPPFVLFCQRDVSADDLLSETSSVPDAETQQRFPGIDESLLKPLPYKEDLGRGYNYINGTDVLLALEQHREIVPAYRNTEGALASMVQMGNYDTIDDVPRNEVDRHIDRMRGEDVSMRHWGQVKALRSKDLLMRAGKTYYPTVKEYVDECLAYGLNKGINVNARQEPPAVNPGRTRCFVVHPHACGENLAGVIGFSYLTRVVYTEDADGEVPKYVEDYESGGDLDVVHKGEPEPAVEADSDSGPDTTTDSEPDQQAAETTTDGGQSVDRPNDGQTELG